MGRQADRNQRARSTWQDRQTRVANNRDPEERARRAREQRERAEQQRARRVWPIVRREPEPEPEIIPPFPLFEIAPPVIPTPPVPILLEESVAEIASSLAEWFEVAEVRTNARRMLSAYEEIQDQHNNRALLSAQKKLEEVGTLNSQITREQLARALASVEEARAAKREFDETGAGRITVKEEKWGKKAAAKPKILVAKVRKDFDRNDPDTWDMLPVRFFNVTRGVIESEPEGSGYIGLLRKGQLDGNGPAGRVRAAVGFRMHTHTSSGSHGISFIYVHIDGRNVEPIVYDIAFSRQDNVYVWRYGAKSAGSSDASYR